MLFDNMSIFSDNKHAMIIIIIAILFIGILNNNNKTNHHCTYDSENYTENFTSASSPVQQGQFLITDSTGNLSPYSLGSGNTLVSDSAGNINPIPTGTFNGIVNANGGLLATTGTFSGALNANGGLLATTGTFNGALNVGGNTKTSAAGISAGLGQINFTNNYQSTPNNGYASEISNDTNTFKSLMLVGNSSNTTSGKRNVGVWDNLTVNGNHSVTGSITTGANYSGTSIGDITANNGNGAAILRGGGGGNMAGHVNFYKADGTRKGYIGWDDGNNNIVMQAENGSPGYYTNGNFNVGGSVNTGNTVNKLGQVYIGNNSWATSLASLNYPVDNDTANFPSAIINANAPGSDQALMIVGNKSGGGVRKVKMWDQVDINGNLNVSGNLCVGGQCISVADILQIKKLTNGFQLKNQSKGWGWSLMANNPGSNYVASNWSNTVGGDKDFGDKFTLG